MEKAAGMALGGAAETLLGLGTGGAIAVFAIAWAAWCHWSAHRERQQWMQLLRDAEAKREAFALRITEHFGTTSTALAQLLERLR